MARWKLTEPHYLKVPGTRWEYSEIDRISGKPKRTMFDVPLYLNPLDSSDWTVKESPDEGYIVVTDGNNAQPRDIYFVGNPTPGMLPLDEAAQAITDQFSWKPTQGLDDISQNESHTAQILNGLMDKMFEVQSNAGTAASVVKIEGMDSMMAAMMKMMEQNQALLAKVLEAPAAKSEHSGRRVG